MLGPGPKQERSTPSGNEALFTQSRIGQRNGDPAAFAGIGASGALSGAGDPHLTKPVESDRLAGLIDRALAQGTAAASHAEGRAAMRRRLTGLTRRQHEILDLIVAGPANKEIAARLRINQRTVESHRALIMEKMGAKSLAELVRTTVAATQP